MENNISSLRKKVQQVVGYGETVKLNSPVTAVIECYYYGDDGKPRTRPENITLVEVWRQKSGRTYFCDRIGNCFGYSEIRDEDAGKIVRELEKN